MERASEVQRRIEEVLGGSGGVRWDGEDLHVTWVDGPDPHAVADAAREILGPYTGSSSVEGVRSYTTPEMRLVLQREYSAAAIGTTVLMQHLLWGCEGCEQTGRAVLTVTLNVADPKRPSSHNGSSRALAVGGAELEKRYEELGEILGVLAETNGNPYVRCRETREYLCSIGHLPGLVERVALLGVGMQH